MNLPDPAFPGLTHTKLRNTGLVPQTLPGGRTQLKCPACRCSVPASHVPGSAECDQDRAERAISQSDEG